MLPQVIPESCMKQPESLRKDLFSTKETVEHLFVQKTTPKPSQTLISSSGRTVGAEKEMESDVNVLPGKNSSSLVIPVSRSSELSSIQISSSEGGEESEQSGDSMMGGDLVAVPIVFIAGGKEGKGVGRGSGRRGRSSVGGSVSVRKRKRGMGIGERPLKKASITTSGSVPTVRKLSECIRKWRPQLVFLSETKCGNARFERVRDRLNMFGICVPAEGRSGGLALLWEKEVVVQLLSYSIHHIDVHILDGNSSTNWKFTGFYGEPDASRRRGVWEKLVCLSNQSDALWLCAGDFNEVLTQEEKTGGPRLIRQIEDFRNALQCSDLSDLGYQGIRYTWCNRRQAPDTVWARLDRACGNSRWCERHSDTVVTHIAVPYSDHVMLRVQWRGLDVAKGQEKRLFRFDARWLAAEDCKENTIRRLRDEEGVWREYEEDIQGILLRYFQAIFTSNGPPDSMINEVLLVQPRVSPEMNQVLATPYTVTEVKSAIFGMFPFKSPGPDGMPPVFFHKFWDIVGSDVTCAVLRILNDQIMLNKMNYTHIVLIPKCETLETVAQLRPISLCNVIVKTASKCIANRLKPMLDSIISPSQSAFIQGRLITDNTLLAFELNHYLQSTRRSKEGCVALKLDMSKAYDRVEWTFLRGTLLRLGFNHRFVSLVMMLVITVSYSLTLNGEHFEVFSCLIQDAERRERLTGVVVARQAPRVSHLLFADDTLVFCGATTEQIGEMRWILQVYARISGQEINFQKSTMVISGGVLLAVKHLLGAILRVRVVPRHDKYLGLPAVGGRSRVALFQNIRDRMWNRIEGWHSKLLSQAGKGVLIKAVLQSLPTYAMSCFQLPRGFLRSLESLMADFWWHSRGERRVHLVAWRQLCRSRATGGLGFRELREFNWALLAKQGWRVLTRPTSLLSQVLKAKYFPTSSFETAEMGSHPSLTWRGICGAKRLLEEGCRQDSEGVWRWRFEQTGKFSVQSAYRQAVIMRDQSMASSSHSNLHLTHGRGSSWSMLWRVGVPPKVRLLMWRLCRGALPTMELLARRATGVDVNCVVCGVGVESIRHVFWECSFARQVWALSNIAWQSISSWTEGPEAWVSGVLARLDKEEDGHYFMICWALWRHRCRRVMEGSIQEPWSVWRNAMVMLESYLSAGGRIVEEGV
ncbi:UNVERIFIED_CONTAM: putative mitochondrial protein [Sesamum radiatum]|uniref:Mitochondrial protein n=1 Tax=Sesamum radiatum TaxID=300843 RepID=A0AAW2S246_SESRA